MLNPNIPAGLHENETPAADECTLPVSYASIHIQLSGIIVALSQWKQPVSDFERPIWRKYC